MGLDHSCVAAKCQCLLVWLPPRYWYFEWGLLYACHILSSLQCCCYYHVYFCVNMMTIGCYTCSCIICMPVSAVTSCLWLIEILYCPVIVPSFLLPALVMAVFTYHYSWWAMSLSDLYRQVGTLLRSSPVMLSLWDSRVVFHLFICKSVICFVSVAAIAHAVVGVFINVCV